MAFTRLYETSTEKLTREVKNHYATNGKLLKREVYEDEELVHYSLFDFPSSDVVEIENFVLNHGSYEESLIVYTLDSNPSPFPAEYYVAEVAWGGFTPSNNMLSYKIYEDNMETPVFTFELQYEYNEGLYPITINPVGYTLTYSCEPVKE